MTVEYQCVVMTPQRFADMELQSNLSIPVKVHVDSEPQWYLPVFSTREAAVEWNGGEDNIVVVQRKVVGSR